MPEVQSLQSPSQHIQQQQISHDQKQVSLLVPDDKLPQSELDDKKAIDIHLIEGFIQVLSAAPTHTPKKFWDSVKLYGDTLYFYDNVDNVWRTNVPNVISEPKRGYLNITTTGLTSVTGFGFQPRFMKFTAYPNDTEQCESVGLNSTAGANTLYKYYDGTKLVSAIDTTDCVVLKNDGASNTAQGGVYSFDIDGFTYNAISTPFSYRVLYEAYP